MKGMPPRADERREPRRLLRPLAVALLLPLIGAGSAPAFEPGRTVIDIARFARWPEEARAGLTFRVCVRDDDRALGELIGLRGTAVAGRRVSVHPLPPGAMGMRPCHLAYFSEGMASREVLEALEGRPVLTVSPQPGFARRGGDVEIGREDGRAVFVVDTEALRRRPVKLSAQFLSIAREATE